MLLREDTLRIKLGAYDMNSHIELDRLAENIFSFANYLLIVNDDDYHENMLNHSYEGNSFFLEFTQQFGAPVRAQCYQEIQPGLLMRSYEKGVVLSNIKSKETQTYLFPYGTRNHQRLILGDNMRWEPVLGDSVAVGPHEGLIMRYDSVDFDFRG
jgi:hypothetical protein